MIGILLTVIFVLAAVIACGGAEFYKAKASHRAEVEKEKAWNTALLDLLYKPRYHYEASHVFGAVWRVLRVVEGCGMTPSQTIKLFQSDDEQYNRILAEELVEKLNEEV